jgi:hypothetical protein
MTIHLAAGGLLLGLVYMFVTSLGNEVVLVLWAVVTGTAAVWLCRLTEVGDGAGSWRSQWLTAVSIAIGSVGTGAILKALVAPQGASGWDAGGALVAGVVARLAMLVRRNEAVCFVCKRPLTGPGGSGECPRCRERICARPSCWNAKGFRCTTCEQRGVVLFPMAGSWWDQRFGPRSMHGACGHCYKEAATADLRECGQCGWPLCRRCWDHHNGACPRCAWVVAGAPPEVVAVAQRHRKSAAKGRASGDGRRHAARR